ncbi:B-type cyclin [Coemansia sp. Benny D160-2]|nr:B-type cyclin [Coemansia sp. Benny D160-2]
MFQNRGPLRSQNTRIPIRRAGAAGAGAGAINDENKVGGPLGARIGGKAINDPIKPAVASKFRPGATVGLGGGMPARATANIPVKAFGGHPSNTVTGIAARPRAALGNVPNVKHQGAVSRLVKPGEIAARIPPSKLAPKNGRIALSGITKPLASGIAGRPIANAVAPAHHPPAGANAHAARAATLAGGAAMRAISKPAVAFAGRRARPLSSGGSSDRQHSFAGPTAASSFKRARTVENAPPAADTESVLGKHTRSGRSPQKVAAETSFHDAAAPVSAAVLPEATASGRSGKPQTVASEGSADDDSSSTAVSSEEARSWQESTHSSIGIIQQTASPALADLKLVENDTLDYALTHSGPRNEHPITADEIRAFEVDVDPQDMTLVAEFSDDIFGYMRELEHRLMPDPAYVERQPALSWSTRSVLVEWLVQVHHRFNLLPETLHLSINFVDRFLSAKEIYVNKLQLVGAVALLVAAKYEEIRIPSVKDIEYMVEKNYGEDEILRAERFMLRMLNFDLGWPGPLSFLRRISKADDYDMATRTLAKYLIEVTLMDERFIGVPCSLVAATAHYLALRFLGKGPWSRAHVFYSGYFESELLPHALVLVELLMHPRGHRAIFQKYADRGFLRASEYVYQWFKINTPDMVLTPTGADAVPEAYANASYSGSF